MASPPVGRLTQKHLHDDVRLLEAQLKDVLTISKKRDL